MHVETTIGWKGKKKKEFQDVLSTKEVYNNFIVKDIIEDPSAVLEELDLSAGFLDKKPFSNLRTGSDIWEFYLIKMFRIKETEYNRWIGDFQDKSHAYKYCTRRKVGNPWSQFNDNDVKYPTINNNPKLIKSSEKFVGRLQQFKGALRQKDRLNSNNRKKAAAAFNDYLLGPMKFGKETMREIFLTKKMGVNDDEILTKLLERSYWKKNCGLNPNHMLAICLMLCLYGNKKRRPVSCKMAKEVCYRLDNLKKSELKEKIILKLMDQTAGFKKDFIPPYNNIFGKYNRERINTFFRIKTWIKLVKDTYLASK